MTFCLSSMRSLTAKLKQNWKSGVTVSLVSIPLSVSLAVASHASPSMGIVTAVWAGLVASLFGGSNFNIVGPTGALSGLLAMYAMTHGAGTLPMLALLSGALILIAQLLRMERYLVLVPGSAIHGFTLGVAFIIGLNQMNFALGLSGLETHEKFIQNVVESARHVGSASLPVVLVFAVSLTFLFLFKKFRPKLPGAILLAPLGILAGYAGSAGMLPFHLPTLGALYPSIAGGLFLPYTFVFKQTMIAPAFAIALIAIIETMVSAKIADGMTKTKYHKQNEMRGLALANIASGVMGGMPATAALARTSLNVKTGADDKLSATISSIGVGVISLVFLGYFTYIPLAVIAAILVYVAVQMVEAEHFKRMFAHDRKSFFVAIFVAFVTIYVDPIVGIILGVGIALLILVEKLSRGQFDLIVNDQNKKIVRHITGEKLQEITEGSNTIVYSIGGLLCYVNGEAHLERFHRRLNGFENIILRLRDVYYVDIDGAEAMDEIIRVIQAKGKNVFVSSVNPLIDEMLNESEAYKNLKADGNVFEKSSDVLKHLGFRIA
ncbi:SulP family inorganic anion transporter [Patescibacteria group bacterium]|nr:MAG: SulP family inorganic anion transporter [Patescibacteria group bacterium]